MSNINIDLDKENVSLPNVVVVLNEREVKLSLAHIMPLIVNLIEQKMNLETFLAQFNEYYQTELDIFQIQKVVANLLDHMPEFDRILKNLQSVHAKTVKSISKLVEYYQSLNVNAQTQTL